MEVMSSCLVKMANNGHQIPMSRMELTPSDLQCLLLDPIQKGILFHKPNESQQFQNNVIDHLKNSLSRTLDFFPPLAGRLGSVKNDEDNTTCFSVHCNNAGAEFTHATTHTVSVSDIMEARYIPEIVYSFFPLNDLIPNCEGVSKPVLGVQVTELVDGLFIGLTANHVVVDGACFWHFFNSWSEISRGFDKISKSPVFDRWFPNNIGNYNLSINLPPLEKNMLTNNTILLQRVFHFSKESLARLKAKANSEADSNKISTLQALSAHLWRSIVRYRRLQNINNNLSSHDAYIILPVGTRPRIPLPEGYFGNALYFVRLGTSEKELLRNGLGYAGLKINELVTKQNNEAAIKFVQDWVKNPILLRPASNYTFVMVTSSPRHDVYANDFGWGKPIAVRSGKVQYFDGNMRVHPAAVSGGIEVEVCLAPETLKALEDDAEFMEACSQP